MEPMLNVESYILLLLALIVCGKWIAFILMCPLLVAFRIRKEKSWKSSENQHNRTADKPDEAETCATDRTPTRKSFLHKVLQTPQYYFFGYRRYIDFR